MRHFEEAKKLSDRIRFYHANKRNRFDHSMHEELDAEIIWGASYFFSAVLYKSEQQRFHYISIEQLKKLKEEFEFETGFEINIDELIMKGWIRIVFGIVSVSKGIQSAGHEAKKVSKLANELIFFLKIENVKKDRKFSIEELKDLASQYENANDLKLDIDAALTNHFYKIEEENVIIQNISIYKLVLENLTNFLFIEKIYNVLHAENETNLQIHIEDLAVIFSSHHSAFPSMPSLDKLIEQKVFSLSSDGLNYFIHFRNNELHFKESVHAKSAAILWNKLLDDNSFKNDTERMFFWYCRIILKEPSCDIDDFFIGVAKDRFLNTALKIVLCDADCTNGSKELWKLRIDGKHTRLYNLEYYFVTENNDLYFPDSPDLFELYEGWSLLKRDHDDELIFGQEARRPLNYFISQLVLNDKEYKYDKILDLLKQGNSRPYIFLKTCFMLYYCRPEVIPFLMENESISSLCLSLLYKLELDQSVSEDSNIIKTSFIIEAFSFLNKSLSENSQLDIKRKATIIFQSLLKVTLRKFRVSTIQQIDRQVREKQERVQLAEKIHATFERTKMPGVIYSAGYRYNDLLYPSLLSELFLLIDSYSSKDILDNGSIGLPFVKLDLLAYLFRLIKKENITDKMEDKDEIKASICEAFCREYLTTINCKEKEKRDYSENNSLKRAIPSWHNHAENEVLINWEGIFLALEEETLLDEFIDPKELVFNKSADKYNEYNRFVAEKLRTHLSILVRAYNNIYNDQQKHRASDFPVNRVLSKLENKITFYIIRYCTHEPSRKRYDIFNDTLERGFWMSNKEELLPVIGSALNKFNKENRQKIIEGLMIAEQVIRSLKLLDYVVSEDEREKLLNVISNHDIKTYLKELSFKDMQFVVQQLSKDQRFIRQAEEALQYTEEVIQKSKRQFKQEEDLVFAFKTKLLLAYHKNDENEIEKIEPPKLTTYIGQRLSATSEKDFYKALVCLKKDEPQKAYAIFNQQLSFAEEDRPVLALNRFASKINWAEQEKEIKNKQKLYREAIEEWMDFEKKASQQNSWQYLKDKIWLNKLYVNEKLQNDQEFDSLYHQLEREIQLRPDFLEIRISSLIRRKMQEQAVELLSAAKQFHNLENGGYPEFIYNLEKTVNTEETLAFLKNQYNRIFRSSPEQLIQIIPENVNKNKKLPDFILNEIINSANDMLSYINSISKVDHEDKYSNLLMLSLNARMQNFQWRAINLSSGFSDSYLLNPGKIDFGIIAANNEKLAICEALILEGKNTTEVQKHNLKIFNYDHVRKLFYVIVYYKGSNDTFLSTWDKYKSTVEEYIVFPKEFALKKKKLSDIKGLEFNSSIKVAKSKHGIGTEIIHVFININYRKNIIKKKIKNKTS